jgi:hypothetical protein
MSRWNNKALDFGTKEAVVMLAPTLKIGPTLPLN